MSGRMEEAIFFADLPNLKNLCAVKIVMTNGISHANIRDKQLKLCRCFLFLHDQIVASPVPEEFSRILVIMSIRFYKTGKVQSVAEKQQVKMESPEEVTPVMLQSCLLYTIPFRLAPRWNKAGHLLIRGADFLAESGKQDAVAIFINVLDNQLFFTVQVHTVRLPPCQLCDFDVAPECLQSSITWNSSIIRKKNYSTNWCYVLPSMKMGRIVHFSHDIPPECPFKSYADFQNYWKTMYGYELPHVAEDDLIYCNVYFKFVGEKLFTYPFNCLRSQPIQFYPRADLTRVQNIFVDDLKSKMPHLCGFPLNMTNTPLYPVKELSRPLLQVNNKHLTNLTATMKLTVNTKTSEQSKHSTEITQKTVALDQPLERCSEKLQYPIPLFVNPTASFKVHLGSQHSDSSRPVSSTHSGNLQKYVPFFCRKTTKVGQIDNTKISGGNKPALGLNISSGLKNYNRSNSILKDTMSNRTSFVQISDAKWGKASNVMQMTSNREVFRETALLPCPPPLSEKQPCILASFAPWKNKSNPKNSEPFQSQVFDSFKLNCTNDKAACMSSKRKRDHNVAGSVNISNKHCATDQLHLRDELHEDIQVEDLVVPPKKCRATKTVKKVDVELHARDNKLFKLNNADLQNWLKQHGISTRTRDKKEQLVAKIMQFIQQS